MFKHLPILLITTFWLGMNYLLWQRDFQATGIAGSEIPVETLWRKILEAPDDSILDIFHQKIRIGSFRWTPTVHEDLAALAISARSEYATEGMIKKAASYSIDIRNGNLYVGREIKRLRYDASMSFDTNLTWETMDLRLTQKPVTLIVAGSKTNEVLHVAWEKDKQRSSRELKFDDLRDPGQIINQLFGNLPFAAFASGLLSGYGSDTSTPLDTLKMLKLGVRYEARQDWLKIGHSKLRAYKFIARLPNQMEAVVYVSRLGEILRVLLPNDIEIRNTRLLLL